MTQAQAIYGEDRRGYTTPRATKKVEILPMNDELFTQRRRVINALYFVRDVLGMRLPYIKVRIVTFEKSSVMGRCYIEKDYINISDDILNWNDERLLNVVAHELLHAYYNAKHDDDCKLMSPYYKDLKKGELIEILKRYAIEHRQSVSA
jgi:hypothetical protein